MSYSPLFEDVIMKLLSQTVICELSHPECFRFVEQPHNQEQIDKHLHAIGRHLGKTSDRLGYFCAYNVVDTTKKRNQIQKQFESFVVDLEGIIDWLRLIRSVNKDSRPLVAGMQLKESELLAAIEESNSLKLLLESISQKLKTGGKSTEARAKLTAVLKYLVEQRYLKAMGGTGTQFVATAKWSLLYDQLEFIRSYDAIEIAQDDNNQQQELL